MVDWEAKEKDFEAHGFNTDEAEQMRASGYSIMEASLYGMGDSVPCIFDSFYGSKWLIGLTPIDKFFTDFFKVSPPEFEVSSLTEIEAILGSQPHSNFRGRMVFRGQTREYFAKRSFPNPRTNTPDGERLILPGYWRKFHSDWNERFKAPPYTSLFATTFGDELVFHGITDWETLGEKNMRRYGIHTMSDLETFPDDESKEYGKRWRTFKVNGPFSRDLPLVEQHYGIETCGLDVTFSPKVAAFFATNKFNLDTDGEAYFGPHTSKDRIIYAFVFRDPSLEETEEVVRDVESFGHLFPTRPIRQRCALPFFHVTNINEAVCDLHCIFRLDEDFHVGDVPTQTELFPTQSEDPFYKAALEVQKKLPGQPPSKKYCAIPRVNLHRTDMVRNAEISLIAL